MELDFLSLDDFDVKGRTVFLRVDFNVPIDPESGRILDEARIEAERETLEALNEARVVLGSHQGRPGSADFASLERHAELLQKYCSQKVRFVEDVIGPEARRAIRDLKAGEVLVLDNLRLCSEENIEDTPERLAGTIMVRRLAPYFDLYVNDAFAAAHRSQASLVGFTVLLPSCAGRLMERELKALKRVLENPERPCTYILGGAKVEDKVPIIENILRSDKADTVLVGGIVAKVFLKAMGRPLSVKDEQQVLSSPRLLDRAEAILARFRDRIIIPEDLAIETPAGRADRTLEEMPREAVSLDIGQMAAQRYADIIRGSKTAVASGPMGVFEKPGYEVGTRIVLEAMAASRAYTVIGGGHLAGYAGLLGFEGRFSHVSTAGGAMLSLLAGEELPAVRALVEASKKHRLG